MSERLERFIEEDCRRNGLPKTQEECCAFAARANLFAHGPCLSDQEFIDRAAGLACGLFGPAYEKAGEYQRITWIDMCERALRDEAAQG